MWERIEKTVKSPEGFFIVFLLALELIFHFTRFGMTGAFILNKVLFAVIVGALIGLAVSVLPKLPGKILSAVFVSVFVLYYLVQLIYSSVFNNFFSLSATGGVADQALDYKSTIFESVIKEIVPFLIFIIILAASLIYIFKFSYFSRHNILFYIIFSAFTATGMFYYVILLSVQGNDNNSPYSVFKTYSSLEMSVQKLGILESMIRDSIYAVQSHGSKGDSLTDTGFDHEALIKAEKVTESDTSSDSVSQDVTEAVTEEVTGEDTGGVTGEVTEESTEETTEEKKVYYAQVLDINLEDMPDITDNASVLELNSYINS